MGSLLLSIQTGFPWYFTVEIQVKEEFPSIWPFSIDPGSAQCLTELIEEDLSTLDRINWNPEDKSQEVQNRGISAPSPSPQKNV